MFIGVSLQQYRKEVAIRLSAKYNKLWVTAEVFLFVLVDATVNINYLENMGAKALLVIFGELVLTAAVLAIVITAPLGAFAIDSTYPRLLKKKCQ